MLFGMNGYGIGLQAVRFDGNFRFTLLSGRLDNCEEPAVARRAVIGTIALRVVGIAIIDAHQSDGGTVD